MKSILWIDDEYSKFDDLRAGLEEQYEFSFAGDTLTAEEKLANLDSYDLLIVDLILTRGEDYAVGHSPRFAEMPYLGLNLLNTITKKTKRPPILVFTIVEDPSVMVALKRMLVSGKVNKFLPKGMLPRKDFADTLAQLAPVL